MADDAVNAAWCPSCGRESRECIASKDREFGLPGRFFIYSCSNCGRRWTEPDLSDDELAGLYPQRDYYAFREKGARPPRRPPALLRTARGYPTPCAPVWLKVAALALRPILNRRYYGVPRYVARGRLLDVGAGAGAFVALATALGWEAIGLEKNAAAAALAREAGLDVKEGDAVRPGDVAGGLFDYFRFHHVLEHLTRPEDALRAAREKANEKAVLLAAVPNAGGLFAKLFGTYWYHWSLPFHRRHFDVATLTTALRESAWSPTALYCVSNVKGFTRSLGAWLEEAVGLKIPWSPTAERLIQLLLRPCLFFLDCLRLGDNLVAEAETSSSTEQPLNARETPRLP